MARKTILELANNGTDSPYPRDNDEIDSRNGFKYAQY